ncbi:MAG: hypothetical protein ACRDD7_10150, partial [Peptostreptococcaceae bacterium]
MNNLSREIEFERINNVLNELLIIIENVKSNIVEKEELNLYENNKIIKFLQSIEDEVFREKESIKELKNPLLLFVVGSGNYGKSTLINSLMKEKIIKTTALPN